MTVQRRRRAKPIQEGRKAPYVIVGHWVAFHPDLAPQAKAVYLVMLCYANGEDLSSTGLAEVWPAREAIAEACGWSRPQSVDQWIDQLVDAGAVEVLPPEPGDADRNNHYLVHATPPEDYLGPRSQADFSKARRAKRGDRKGDPKPQVSRDDAVERTIPKGDAVERTKGDAVERMTPVRSTAHEQEPLTRTIEKDRGGSVPGERHQGAGTPDRNGPQQPSNPRRTSDPLTWVCDRHLAHPDPSRAPCKPCEVKRLECEAHAAELAKADRIAALERKRAADAAAVAAGAEAAARAREKIRAVLPAKAPVRQCKSGAASRRGLDRAGDVPAEADPAPVEAAV